jgi:hypothetical protein
MQPIFYFLFFQKFFLILHKKKFVEIWNQPSSSNTILRRDPTVCLGKNATKSTETKPQSQS